MDSVKEEAAPFYMSHPRDLDLNSEKQQALSGFLAEGNVETAQAIDTVLKAIDLSGNSRRAIPLELYQRACFELVALSDKSGKEYERLVAELVWQTVLYCQQCDQIAREALALFAASPGLNPDQSQAEEKNKTEGEENVC